MHKIGFLVMFAFSLSLLGLTACNGETGGTSVEEQTTVGGTNPTPLTYEQITAEEAKALMDSEEGYILIDARTEKEFAKEHIEGAILIPEYEIADRAAEELPDKDALILVYCRSGRRSKIASEILVYLGYTNVKEFGGIIDWPYETVK